MIKPGKIIIFAIILLLALAQSQPDCSAYPNCHECSIQELTDMGNAISTAGLNPGVTQGFISHDEGDLSNPKVYRWDHYADTRTLRVYADTEAMMTGWGTFQSVTMNRAVGGTYKAVYRGQVYSLVDTPSTGTIGRFNVNTGVCERAYTIPGFQNRDCQWGGNNQVMFHATPDGVYILYHKAANSRAYMAKINPDTLVIIQEWLMEGLSYFNQRGGYFIIGEYIYGTSSYNANPKLINYKLKWTTGEVVTSTVIPGGQGARGYSTCLHYDHRLNELWDLDNNQVMRFPLTITLNECVICVDHFYLTQEHTCDQCAAKCVSCSETFDNCLECGENRENAPTCGCITDYRETGSECLYFCDLTQCAGIYSQCNYEGDGICICRDNPIPDASSQANITQIKSLHVPAGTAISLWEGSDYDGDATITIDEDTPCLETTVYFGIR